MRTRANVMSVHGTKSIKTSVGGVSLNSGVVRRQLKKNPSISRDGYCDYLLLWNYDRSRAVFCVQGHLFASCSLSSKSPEVLWGVFLSPRWHHYYNIPEIRWVGPLSDVSCLQLQSMILFFELQKKRHKWIIFDIIRLTCSSVMVWIQFTHQERPIGNLNWHRTTCVS